MAEFLGSVVLRGEVCVFSCLPQEGCVFIGLSLLDGFCMSSVTGACLSATHTYLPTCIGTHTYVLAYPSHTYV